MASRTARRRTGRAGRPVLPRGARWSSRAMARLLPELLQRAPVGAPPRHRAQRLRHPRAAGGAPAPPAQHLLATAGRQAHPGGNARGGETGALPCTPARHRAPPGPGRGSSALKRRPARRGGAGGTVGVRGRRGAGGRAGKSGRRREIPGGACAAGPASTWGSTGLRPLLQSCAGSRAVDTGFGSM